MNYGERLRINLKEDAVQVWESPQEGDMLAALGLRYSSDVKRPLLPLKRKNFGN